MSTTPPEDPDPGSWQPPPAADPPPSSYPPPYEPPPTYEQPAADPSSFPQAPFQQPPYQQPPAYPPGGYPPTGSAYGGYAAPGYGAGPYGGSPYGYQAPPDHPQGTTILVLGILSLVLGLSCGIGFLLGPVAWLMGNGAIREIDGSGVTYSNRSQIQAGRICGIVATAILLLGAAFFIFVIAVSAGSTA